MSPPLTDRQLTILRLIADGLQYKQVAHAIGIRPSSIKNPVWQIYRKLGARTKTAAVVEAYRRGLIR